MEMPISSAEYAAMTARETSQKQRSLEERIEVLEQDLAKIRTQIFDVYMDNKAKDYYVFCVRTNYEGARGAMEGVLKSKTLEDAKHYANVALMYMDMRAETIYKKEVENE